MAELYEKWLNYMKKEQIETFLHLLTTVTFFPALLIVLSPCSGLPC